MCVVILNANRTTCSVSIPQAMFFVGVYGGINCLAFVGTLTLWGFIETAIFRYFWILVPHLSLLIDERRAWNRGSNNPFLCGLVEFAQHQQPHLLQFFIVTCRQVYRTCSFSFLQHFIVVTARQGMLSSCCSKNLSYRSRKCCDAWPHRLNSILCLALAV